MSSAYEALRTLKTSTHFSVGGELADADSGPNVQLNGIRVPLRLCRGAPFFESRRMRRGLPKPAGFKPVLATQAFARSPSGCGLHRHRAIESHHARARTASTNSNGAMWSRYPAVVVIDRCPSCFEMIPMSTPSSRSWAAWV